MSKTSTKPMIIMIVITMDVMIIRLPTINAGNDDVGPNDSISIVVVKTCLSACRYSLGFS